MQHPGTFSINKHTDKLLTNHTVISYAEGDEKFSLWALARRCGRFEPANKITPFFLSWNSTVRGCEGLLLSSCQYRGGSKTSQVFSLLYLPLSQFVFHLFISVFTGFFHHQKITCWPTWLSRNFSLHYFCHPLHLGNCLPLSADAPLFRRRGL